MTGLLTQTESVRRRGPSVKILLGTALDLIGDLPDESVHCVVTSPPYFGLRNYGIPPSVWKPVRYSPMAGLPEMPVPVHADPESFPSCSHEFYGNPHKPVDGNFCRKCGSWSGCLGNEPTPELFVGHIVQVFREVRRVLRSDGTLWLNMGDSYVTSGGPNKKYPFMSVNPKSVSVVRLPEKNLLMIPSRVAMALQSDGWILRSDIIWHKPNPMPGSYKDRCTSAHEYVYMFAKRERYFFNSEAIAEPASFSTEERKSRSSENTKRFAENRVNRIHRRRGHERLHNGFNGKWDRMTKAEQCSGTRNKRDVWTIATRPFHEAHYATFPEELPRQAILAGTAANVCSECGAPRNTGAGIQEPLFLRVL